MTEPQDPYGGQPYQPHPGYPPPGYATQPYATQPYAGQPAYPPAAYQPFPVYGGYPGYPGYPGLVPVGPARPGTVTAAAVLGFISGGLLILAGLILVLGAALTDSLSDEFDQHPDSFSTELALAGVVNLVAAALLIAGGVMLVGRKPGGRTLTIIGSGIVVVATVYWIARPDDATDALFPALIFAALVVIASSLLTSTSARTWFDPHPSGGVSKI